MPSMKRRPYQRWDGDIKSKTKNCEVCEFEVDFLDREICAWGVAFKYLSGTESDGLRKCEYFGKEPLENNSLAYVLQAKKDNLFGKSRNYKNHARQLTLVFKMETTK